MNDLAYIIRNKKTKAITLYVEKDLPWKIYAGTGNITKNTDPILSGKAKGEFILPIKQNQHMCFTFQTEDTTHILAERLLPMEGGFNIRDLGGYIGANGKKVVWGTFFRSDDLAKLSDTDIDYLASIPITTVFDFRTDKEAKETPDRFPYSVRNAFRRPLSPGNVSPAEIMHGNFNAYDDATAFMHTVYRELVSASHINAVYKELFQYLQDDNKLPILFHCTAGKDRTGMAAAFLLLSLGVSKDTIIRDYMDSNTYLAGKYTKLIENNPQLATLYSVKSDYLLTAFKTMENLCGSIDTYLSHVLGINLDKMRTKYLY